MISNSMISKHSRLPRQAVPQKDGRQMAEPARAPRVTLCNIVVFCGLFLAACASSPRPDPDLPFEDAVPFGGRAAWAAVAGRPLQEIAEAVFAAGGSAGDAAIAVTLRHAAGDRDGGESNSRSGGVLGGGGHCLMARNLVARHGHAQVTAVSGLPRATRAPGRIALPGTLAVLAALHDRSGRLTWTQTLGLARRDILPGTGGQPLQAAYDLLEAEGPYSLYRGALGARFRQQAEKAGQSISAAELAAMQAALSEARPVQAAGRRLYLPAAESGAGRLGRALAKNADSPAGRLIRPAALEIRMEAAQAPGAMPALFFVLVDPDGEAVACAFTAGRPAEDPETAETQAWQAALGFAPALQAGAGPQLPPAFLMPILSVHEGADSKTGLERHAENGSGGLIAVVGAATPRGTANAMAFALGTAPETVSLVTIRAVRCPESFQDAACRVFARPGLPGRP